MDRRRRPERIDRQPPPSPLPSPSPSLLRDVSNYKTPRPHRLPTASPSPSPFFFTASKKTPSSSLLRPRPSSAAHSNAGRRLKALELEQSRSARKVQHERHRALQAFSRSLAAWLNFLLRNPRSCGCTLSNWIKDPEELGPASNGKRESIGGPEAVGIGGAGWRSPKRQRNAFLRGSGGDGDGERGSTLAPAAVAALKASLQEVCSVDDVKERLGMHMSRKSCDEVLSMMSHVCKCIDEGRLRMKAHCPIVTDLGQKKKAIGTLMCYNPMWLRVGLHIVFGGDSSLLNGGGISDQEDLFLKMTIEKQFFSHSGVAKAYAYNKLVEGLYRPGYYQVMGNIILKRILLLIISLDKAKCESTLPLKYGIDGIDGGSPLLFRHHSHIKSSRQVIQDFLSEVMHGEGDLLAHLVIVGCKVNHQQLALVEYDFNISNISEDLQDGILLCRVIQLLQSDASILSKIMAPSDTRKKNLHNCNIAIQHLKQLGVPLSDGDGVTIVAEDIANGDKELLLSILWNIFVHLQVPLLIEERLLVDEIAKIKGSYLDLSRCNTKTSMSLLLEWIQAICGSYGIRVDSFSSLTNGKGLCCLIDYYIRLECDRCNSSKENHHVLSKELLETFDSQKMAIVHNSLSVQRVTEALGNFPEISDLLDHETCDERSIAILSVFLTSKLINRKNLDQITISRVARSLCGSLGPKSSTIIRSPLSRSREQSSYVSRQNNVLTFDSPLKQGSDEYKMKEWAARVIQSQFRGLKERKKYLKVKMTTSFLQAVIRAWLAVTSRSLSKRVDLACSTRHLKSEMYSRYFIFMVERHNFLRIKSSVLLIQRAVRCWISRRHHVNAGSDMRFVDDVVTVDSAYSAAHEEIVVDMYVLSPSQLVNGGKAFRKCDVIERQNNAATKIQLAWRTSAVHKFYCQETYAAVKIQSHWRSWYIRRSFLFQVGAVLRIQSSIRGLIYRMTFKQCTYAATEIQRFVRGQIVRRRLLGASSRCQLCKSCHEPFKSSSNSLIRDKEIKILINSVLKLQRWWRKILSQKLRTMSVILIQSFIRGWHARKLAHKQRHCISIIQRWWRHTLFLISIKRSVVIIQANIRGWLTRRAAKCNMRRVVVIQSYWRGYLVRKSSRQQVSDLRCRLQKSAGEVEDNMRLINRLVSALSELLGHRSISNIRHTCATLNLATEHSQKCCETLVAAGAINILLKLVHSLNRGVPDQEVLKHVLSTLRNVAGYPQFIELLANIPFFAETIFQELLRNKNEGFFIACDILKRLCAIQQGLGAVCKLHGHIKRLKSLAQNLQRKSDLLKRNASVGGGSDDAIHRWREASSLLELIADGDQRQDTPCAFAHHVK